MLTFEVKDFGPIGHGRVELRPLTVFIGPNNAGKSYLSMVVYALLKASQRYQSIRALVREAAPGHPLGSRPYATTAQLEDQLGEYARMAESELERCFATELSGLVRRGAPGSATIALRGTHPPFRVSLEFDRRNSRKRDYQAATQGWAEGELKCVARYFPAARSGILHSHKALASVLVSMSPLAGIQPLEVPRLSGVVADFIGELLVLRPSDRRHLEVARGEEVAEELATVATFLETKIGQGEIHVEVPDTRLGYPEISYRLGPEELPLHRTSSTVSEIAPIVLFLKYAVRRGDLLVIEEPEAHLHPENQRILARAVVKLIRAGVWLLATTHSDYFLQQLSHFVKLSSRPDLLSRLAYDAADYLKAGEVGAYLFTRGEESTGSRVEHLEVSVDSGIPEEEFVRVAEALYEEGARLDMPAGQG